MSAAVIAEALGLGLTDASKIASAIRSGASAARLHEIIAGIGAALGVPLVERATNMGYIPRNVFSTPMSGGVTGGSLGSEPVRYTLGQNGGASEIRARRPLPPRQPPVPQTPTRMPRPRRPPLTGGRWTGGAKKGVAAAAAAAGAGIIAGSGSVSTASLPSSPQPGSPTPVAPSSPSENVEVPVEAPPASSPVSLPRPRRPTVLTPSEAVSNQMSQKVSAPSGTWKVPNRGPYTLRKWYSLTQGNGEILANKIWTKSR